jgi:cell division septum initiation protein DivIVA
VRRGYDPEQVRDYLGQVAVQVETLELGLREAKMQGGARSMSPGEALAGKMASETVVTAGPVMTPAPEATSKDDAYARLTARFGRMIESADREATAVVDEAKAGATQLLDEARGEADRVRLDAQARAEEARQQGNEALRKAKIEADRILGSLATRRETLVSQMQEMQSKLLSVAKDLESAMDEREAAQTTSSTASASSSATRPSASGGDDLVDPRYEDLWVSRGKDAPIDIPDLAAIDLDLDDDKPSSD